MQRKKVTLDPGHGGKDPGAIGPTGVMEKNITLPVCQKVAGYLLPAGIDVRLTHDTDSIPWQTGNINKDLAARCKIANDWGADIFVSVHTNSAANTTAHGNEIYTTSGQGSADALANCIHNRYKAAFPELTYREDWSDGDADKEAGFYVLKNTNMPAVLTELAFISNPQEEKLLASPEFQAKAALAIAQGIGDYFGVGIPLQGEFEPEKPRIQVGGAVLEGILVDGRTYAPVRALAEALGYQVSWDEKSKTVVIK